MTGKGGDYPPEPSSGWIIVLILLIAASALILTKANLP